MRTFITLNFLTFSTKNKPFAKALLLFMGMFLCQQNLLAKTNTYRSKGGLKTVCSITANQNIFIDYSINPCNLIALHSDATFQLISHGRSGELLLNGKWCNAQEIAKFMQPKLHNSKFKIHNLNIYGCEFAKGGKGLQAVKYLENTLRISVSASTNITGKDGDWVLEVGKAKDVIALNNYNGNLQCPNGTLNSNQYATGSTGGYANWGNTTPNGSKGAPDGVWETIYSTPSGSDAILTYANSFLSGDTVKITGKWYDAVTYKDSITIAFSSDGTTWSSFTPYINGFNATSFTTVNVPLPASAVGSKYIKVAGKSGYTITYLDAIQVGQMRCLGYPVSGTAFNDNGAGGGTASNCVKDGTESGTLFSSGMYVKLKTVAGATDISATTLAADGTINISDVANGTYVVFLDDNNSLTDVTSNLPFSWSGTSSKTITVTNGVASPAINFCLTTSCPNGVLNSNQYATGSTGGYANWGNITPNGSKGAPDNVWETIYSTTSGSDAVLTYANSFLSGDTVKITGEWYDAATYKDSITIAFSSDGTTWSSFTPYINGFNATSFTTVNVPLPASAVGSKYIRVAGKSGYTITYLDAIQVGQIRCMGYPVSGTAFNDNGAGGGTANNCIKDGTESGTLFSSGMYVKLKTVAGATDISATALAADGTINISDVANGTYVVFLDDNNSLTDVTSTLPFSWSGTSSKTITVTNGVASPAINFCLTTTCVNGVLNSNQYATASSGGTANWGNITPNGAVGAPDGIYHSVYNTTSTSDAILTYANSFVSGDTVRITGKWYDAVTYKDSITIAFSSDGTTWSSFTPYINGFNATSFTTVNVPLPASAVGSKYIRVAGKSGYTITYLDAIQVGQIRCMGYPVSGTAFNDNGAGGGTANNCIKDGTESGSSLPSGLFVKLKTVNGSPAIKASALAADGTFSITDVANGSYVVFLDNNNVLSDTSASNPTDYRGAISKTVTITNGVASPTLNFCVTFKDTDGDGIGDDTDIDDDNDGILDAVECPSCYYTAAEASAITNVTTQLGVTNIANTYDATGTSTYGTGTNSDPVAGKTIYEVTYTNPVPLSAVNLNYYSNYSISSGTTKVRLEGWNGSSWVSLTAGDSIVVPAYSTTDSFKVTKNAGSYLKYRIQGVSGSTYLDYVTDITSVVSSNYCPSSYPKPTCTTDTDGDGITNDKDLDSDGDGCPDAVEANVTSTAGVTTSVAPAGKGAITGTAKSIINGPYGGNGFADILQTSFPGDTNTYKGIYTYNNFATNASINACTDTDGDGIPDVFDLDDDNDGILDIVECPYSYNPALLCDPVAKLTNLVVNGDFESGNTGFSSTYVNTGASTPGGCANYAVIATGWISSTGSCSGGSHLDLNGSCSLPLTPFWCQSVNVTPNTNYTFSYLSKYTNGGTIIQQLVNGAVINTSTITGSWVKYSTIYNSGNNTTLNLCLNDIGNNANADDFGVDDIMFYPTNYNFGTSSFCDTDGDGIPNSLDLDSDGDGCSDAKEAGVAGLATTTVAPAGMGATTGLANSVAPAPYSGNGFSDVLQTSLPGDTNTYKGYYTYQYATSKVYNVCSDVDADGVNDIADIDADNDGILDAVECPSCYYTAAEANVISTITTDLTNDTYAAGTTDMPILHDGLATPVVTYNVATALTGKSIATVTYPTPVKLADLTVNVGATFVGTTPTAKLQGSKDGFTWFNLTATPAADKTLAAGAQTFTVTQNADNYMYYRVTGTSGTSSTTSTITEITSNLAANYCASLNPKTTCTTDTDGDGITNDKDLDSDGDGCPDAIEAGTNIMAGAITSNAYSGAGIATGTTKSVINGPYGGNGFADVLQTSFPGDTNTYKGTYSYSTYATNSTINACTDTDGDGIPDVFDLDDDNDGILDVNEMYPTSCPSLLNGIVDGSFESAAPVAWNENTNTASLNSTLGSSGWSMIGSPDTWTGSFSTSGSGYWAGAMNGVPATSDGNVFAAIYNGFTNEGMSTTANLAGQFTVGDTLGFNFKQIFGGCNGITGLGAKARFRFTINGVQYLTDTLTYNGNNPKSWQNGIFYFVPNSTTLNITIDIVQISNSTNDANYLGIDGINLFKKNSGGCDLIGDKDTDGDGIPDRLDLDSDGDGCPDAKEGGGLFTSLVSSTLAGGNSGTGFKGITPNPGPVVLNLGNTVGNTATTMGVPTIAGTGQSVNYSESKTLNFCADTDGDGIPDLIDIDDDNDGILDAVECPSCYYTAAEASAITNVTTQLGVTNIANTYDATGTSTYGTGTNSDPVAGKTIYEVTYTNPVPLSAVNLNYYSNYSISSGTTKVRLEGWNGSSWVSLTAGDSIVVPAYSTIDSFKVTKNAGSYLKYRIQGVSGSTYYDYVSNITSVVSPNYCPSSYPKPTCTTDTDGDGITNDKDLDSDGDGCPDAVEANVTSTAGVTTSIAPAGKGAITGTAKSIINGPYGGNGFADILQTSFPGDTNTYKGIYTYSTYATNSALNTCTDTDGDGIPDVFDLDDDNDGVLDVNEMINICNTTVWNVNTYGNYTDGGAFTCPFNPSGAVIGTGIKNGANFNANVGPADLVNFLGQAGVLYSGIDDVNRWMVEFIHVVRPEEVGTITFNFGSCADMLRIYKNSSSLYCGGWPNITGGVVSFNIAAGDTIRFYTGENDNSSTWMNIVTSFSVGCLRDIDTDGDGIPNRLDLDSDGDGCPDAIEAGVSALAGISMSNAPANMGVATGTANAVAPSPYGANGFSDFVETSTESGVYKGIYTYNQYALNKNINLCDDCDGDGIPNVFDLDDDNDGILDAVECPSCYSTQTASKSIFDVSSDLTYDATTSNMKMLFDSVATPNFNFSTVQTLAGKNIFILTMPTSVQLDTVKISDPITNTGTANLYGSTDGITFVKLTSPDVNITNTPTNFVVNQNAGFYKYYKVQGVTGSTVIANKIGEITTGVTAAHAAQYPASLYPLPTGCPLNSTNDKDGDGILNTCDLDSDGDGCSDAQESGVIGTLLVGTLVNKTVSAPHANSIAQGPYGANGFADPIQKAAAVDSNAYNGTYTYSNALDSTIASCTKVKATPDKGTISSAVGGVVIANIVNNDSIYGMPATVGTNGSATISKSGTWPTGISLDTTTGAVSVVKATTPATYLVSYTICDKSLPKQCVTKVDTVIVTPLIKPKYDSLTVTSNGGGATPNIALGDSVNGRAATIGAGGNATISKSGTWPSGITLDSTTGLITIAKGTKPGKYAVPYNLCDTLNPKNCAVMVDTVWVTPYIKPKFDSLTVTSNGGGAIPNIALGDSVNGKAAVIGAGGNATISKSGTWPTGITLDSLTGLVTVAKGTAPGKYAIPYNLCDTLNPKNCAVMVDTVWVTSYIKPKYDSLTVSALGGGASPNIALGDSVNGKAAVIGAGGNATISKSGTWPTGFTLDTLTGKITIPGGITPGKYPVTYLLCDTLTPKNCATMVDTIWVTPVINPIREVVTVPSSGAVAFSNIASNDSVNSYKATLGSAGNATVSTVGTWPSNIKLDSLGKVTVLAGISAGKYPVTYQLCDKLTPANCKTMVDTIYVNPIIASRPDTGTIVISGGTGTAINNITINDSTNGVPVVLTGPSRNTIISKVGVWPTGITFDSLTGKVTIAGTTPVKTYSVVYQSCDTLKPANCTTTTVFLRVRSNPLPVELLSFEAKLNESNTVSLDWKTATEINNNRFEVERSTDAKNFTVIGVEKTQATDGNSTEILSYMLLDKTPENGINYYRLHQFDNDGTNTYSAIQSVEIKSVLEQIVISVYPNPTVNGVYFNSNNLPEIERIFILDLHGKEVGEKRLEGTENYLNLADLPASEYEVVFQLKNGKKISKKILKN